MTLHLLLALALLTMPAALDAQAPEAPSPPRAQVIAAAKDVMKAARYATLVTVGPDGQPQARIVDPFAPDDDMTIWIATKPVTRKVADIRRDARVTLLYFDTVSKSYVTLLGRAEPVTDAAERARRWKDGWAGMYKDANRGDDYLLIRVRPFRMEVLSMAHGLGADPDTWRPVGIDVP